MKNSLPCSMNPGVVWPIKKVFLFIGATMALATSASASSQDRSHDVEAMFYNVYNLFDAIHDEGKEDWTFLPRGYEGKQAYCRTITHSGYREECERLNWDARSVEIKLDQLVDALTRDRAELPDLLGLAEVENRHIVGLLAHRLGFKRMVMTDSPDHRGIDVALLFRPSDNLVLVKSQSHRLKGATFEDKPTRDILEVEFKVAGTQSLLVFVNHWPSPAAPASVRVNVAKQLQAIVNQRIWERPDVNILMMGDFNTLDEDRPHPFQTVLLSPSAPFPLSDVHDLFMNSLQVSPAAKKALPNGTYFYGRDQVWNRLDRFFVNASLTDGQGMEVAEETYKIYAPDFLSTWFYRNDQDSFKRSRIRVPRRYNIYARSRRDAGYSDHYPVLVTLRLVE